MSSINRPSYATWILIKRIHNNDLNLKVQCTNCREFEYIDRHSPCYWACHLCNLMQWHPGQHDNHPDEYCASLHTDIQEDEMPIWRKESTKLICPVCSFKQNETADQFGEIECGGCHTTSGIYA
jgi:ribosomal protein S27E